VWLEDLDEPTERLALDNIECPPTQVGGDQRAISLFLGIFDGHDEPFGFVGADIPPCTPYHRSYLNTTADADGEGRPRMDQRGHLNKKVRFRAFVAPATSFLIDRTSFSVILRYSQKQGGDLGSLFHV
jgi:hypothetical protein